MREDERYAEVRPSAVAGDWADSRWFPRQADVGSNRSSRLDMGLLRRRLVSPGGDFPGRARDWRPRNPTASRRSDQSSGGYEAYRDRRLAGKLRSGITGIKIPVVRLKGGGARTVWLFNPRSAGAPA